MRKYNLKRRMLVSINLKVMVILLIFFFIYTLGYKYTLHTLFEKKEKVDLKLKHLNQELKKKHYKIIEFYKNNNIYDINKKINFFLNQDDSSYFSQTILHQLFPTSFYINQINISSYRKNCFLNVIEIKSTFLSSFDDIFRFLNQISKSNQHIILKNFKWIFPNVQSNIQKHDINFIFSIYMPYLSKNSFLSAFDKKYRTYTKNSFSKEINLIKFPLDKIKLIGFLSFLSEDRNNKFALVKLSNDQIFKVKMGDYLGLEQHTVVGIYNDEIFIQDKNLNKIKIIKLKI